MIENNNESGFNYTDPSEIKSLSKYLKKGIQERDSKMQVSDSMEPILPSTTKSPAQLDDTLVGLEGPKKVGLDQTKISIDPKNPEKLETKISRIEDKGRSNLKLDQERPELRDHGGPESLNQERSELRKQGDPESLDQERPEIRDYSVQEKLSEAKPTLTVESLKELIKEKRTLNVSDLDLSLSRDRSKVPGELNEVDRLSTTRIGGKKAEELYSLDPTKEELRKGKELKELDDTQVNLKDSTGDPELSKEIKDLKENSEIDSLDKTKIQVEGQEDRETLSEYISQLKAFEKEVGLSGERIPIIGQPKNLNSLRADKIKVGTDERGYYQEIQKYLGLDSIEQAKEYQMTIEEYERAGEWGKKAAALLTSILGRSSSMRSHIPKENIQRLLESLEQSFGGVEAFSERTPDSDFPGIKLKDGVVKGVPEKSREEEGKESIPVYPEMDRADNFSTDKYSQFTDDSELRSGKAVLRGTRDKQGDVEWGMRGQEVAKIPKYQMGEINLNSSVSDYIRYAVEQTIGTLNAEGATKQALLDEALRLAVMTRTYAEESLKSSPGRLPGNETTTSILGGLLSGSKGITSAVTAGVGALLKTNSDGPVNRPNADGSQPKILKKSKVDPIRLTKEERETYGDDAEFEFDTTVWKSNRGDVNFYDDYIASTVHLGYSGLDETMNGLSYGVLQRTEGTYEQFKERLLNSPYITTSTKITNWQSETNSPTGGDILTLDSNHVWEIQIFPYLSCTNGYRSWLPSVAEMNYSNLELFGYRTHWNNWIPFSGFEVTTKKLSSRNLNLFNGQIDYPVAIEFVNELRMTIIDDTYKTWKRYFQLVSDVSAYHSNIHTQEFYRLSTTDFLKASNTEYRQMMTAVNRDYQTPGNYKNLTFRCIIYSMNPQYCTVRKLDLLCVLKDFADSWQGESDAAGTELSLSFSIVGELSHPNSTDNGARPPAFEFRDKSLYVSPQKKEGGKINYGSIIGRGISKASGILKTKL